MAETAWYLFADPSYVPLIEVSFMGAGEKYRDERDEFRGWRDHISRKQRYGELNMAKLERLACDLPMVSCFLELWRHGDFVSFEQMLVALACELATQNRQMHADRQHFSTFTTAREPAFTAADVEAGVKAMQAFLKPSAIEAGDPVYAAPGEKPYVGLNGVDPTCGGSG